MTQMLTIIQWSFRIFLLAYVLIHLPMDVFKLKQRSRSNFPHPDPDGLWFGLLIISTLVFWVTSAIVAFSESATKRLMLVGDYGSSFNKMIVQTALILFWAASIVEFAGRLGRSRSMLGDEMKLGTGLGHRIVRHPQYFAYSVWFVTTSIILLNPLLLLMALGIPGYVQVARLEDQELHRMFGEDFANYASKIGSMFPFIGHWERNGNQQRSK